MLVTSRTLIKNMSKKHSGLFLKKHLYKKKLFIFLSYSLQFPCFFSILYSFPLIDFVTIDMCFYLVINKEFT